MAYLNHDLEDAIRSKVVSVDQVPESCSAILGNTHSQRATTMIRDLISVSEIRDGELCLKLSDEVHSAMMRLRQFLYDNVYRSPKVHKDFEKSKKILSELYRYFLDNTPILEQKLTEMQINGGNIEGQPQERIVCDLIASMTDRYAMNLYKKIFFPSPLV